MREAGAEAVTFLGGATGLYCGYLDFIAWDLPAVLKRRRRSLKKAACPMPTSTLSGGMWAVCHCWMRKEPEPDIHEETGSLLSAEDIETLESFDEGTAGYFGKMLHWLENFIKNGVEEGRFTKNRPIRICRSPSGMPLPATIWMTISTTTGQRSG